MATAVERPLNNDTSNREVIDVDEFDFTPQPSQSRGEQIYFVDSDGEEDFIEILSPRLQASSSGSGNPTRHHVPAGPRRNPSIPPPVPPIPARFSGLPTSLPQRRQGQSTRLPNLPPVIPSQEPLPFEIFASSPARQPTASPAPVAGPGPSTAQSTSSSGAPQAAAPSHHTPSMGLGGALITSNRRDAHQRQRSQIAAELQRRRNRAAMLMRAFDADGEDGPSSSGSGSGAGAATGAGSGSSNRSGASSGSRRRWRALANNIEDLFTDGDDDAQTHQQMYVLVNGSGGGAQQGAASGWATGGTWGTGGMSWQDLAMRHMGLGTEARDKDQYLQRFTHPPRPEPGFTFDFDASPETSRDAPIVIDDDGVVVTPDISVTSSLVCARCTEPLVLNAAMAEEEASLKRIWALRCGHLIDEKCLNEIGIPPQEAAEEIPTKSPAKVDRKGKGKAKATSSTIVHEPPPSPATIPAQEQGFGGIRSRLRSHIAETASTLFSMVGPSSPQVPADPAPPPPPPAKKRRVGNRKPKIEGTFSWPCPVASCRREHVSVKIDGVWGPEKDVPPGSGKKSAASSREAKGAIPVFA